MDKKERPEPELKLSNKFNNMDMYDFYLTPKEQQLITYLNKNTNRIKEAKEGHDRFENLSIKTIYKRWSDRIYKIINEMITEFQKLVNTQPSDSLQKQNELKKYQNFLMNTVNIMVKDDRLLYVGLTLVIISFFVYFVSVSSS